MIREFLVTTQNDCVGNAEEKRACWFTIRSTKPNHEFNIPRWHQDGRMYPYDQGREEVVRSKYALTLLEPPTLMLMPDEDAFATERQGRAQHFWWQEKDTPRPSEEEKDGADLRLRKWLENEFKDNPRVQVGNGQVVLFSWGRDNSPFHSEPDLICDRIFMSVLYGSEPELRGMCDWREAEYGIFETSI
ncbi:unnamed protein product [Fusarium langsethiae]|nr:unnamed protein product [Fusarium langsethiae]